jgi:hypothetical protein
MRKMFQTETTWPSWNGARKQLDSSTFQFPLINTGILVVLVPKTTSQQKTLIMSQSKYHVQNTANITWANSWFFFNLV